MQEIIFQSNKCGYVWKTTVLLQEMCRYWIGMFWCFRFGGMGKDKPKLNNPESSGSLVTRYVLHPLHSPLYWSLIVQFNYVIFSVSGASNMSHQSMGRACYRSYHKRSAAWRLQYGFIHRIRFSRPSGYCDLSALLRGQKVTILGYQEWADKHVWGKQHFLTNVSSSCQQFVWLRRCLAIFWKLVTAC